MSVQRDFQIGDVNAVEVVHLVGVRIPLGRAARPLIPEPIELLAEIQPPL